jgi:prepilin-type N-terminal cleavage/methylation domain-containing protein/prepilin-type processing-associated H-X9-DG protein
MKRKEAFTLVELLVVIAIIAVLIALLMPALAAANGQAKTVQCMSNLHQLAIAAQQYCISSGGYYPIAYYGDYRPPQLIQYNWDFTTVTNLSTGNVTVQPGLLWQGVSISQVQQCPVFDGSSNTVADPYTGYNYNASYLGGGPGWPPAKAAQIRHPSLCAMFGDGQYYNGADKFMRAPFPSSADLFFGFTSPSSGTQGFRHRGKTNVAFCDGHGETWPNRYTTTSDSHPPGAATGFLSADNSAYNAQ